MQFRANPRAETARAPSASWSGSSVSNLEMGAGSASSGTMLSADAHDTTRSNSSGFPGGLAAALPSCARAPAHHTWAFALLAGASGHACRMPHVAPCGALNEARKPAVLWATACALEPDALE